MVCTFFSKKTGAEMSVNTELAQKLHELVIKKKSKKGKVMLGLKIIFGLQI